MKEKQQLFIEAILLKHFPIISLSSVYHSKMVSIPFFFYVDRRVNLTHEAINPINGTFVDNDARYFVLDNDLIS